MSLKAHQFFDKVKPLVTELNELGLVGKVYSDSIDQDGNQYVDLVMEGGGVLGIALAGYIYILEVAGLRFCGLGGASAGSITALALAAIDAPQAAKSARLVELITDMPMASFVDGKDDADEDAPDFIKTMLKRPGLARGLWKAMQVVDNVDEMLGLNRGDRFHKWLKDAVLDPVNISTTKALRERMARTPQGWHLRRTSKHRDSQLQGAQELPALDPDKDYLCIVAADIATETKVEFPRMACIYWDDVGAVHPADYARCSMSIPGFFKPFSVPLTVRSIEHINTWCHMAGLNKSDFDKGFPPTTAVFVDGGILSNFPIDVFHNSQKIPSRPTFGVKLQWDARAHEIDKLSTLVTQVFNSSRHCLDYEFIRKNPDFNQLVSYIDTGKHDWLNFNITDNDKLDLFARGSKAALSFLTDFDWERYKDTRSGLVRAFQEASRPQTIQI